MGPTAVVLFTLTLIACCSIGTVQPQPPGAEDCEDFAVEITGGLQVADEVARKYGYHNRGKVGNLEHVFLFEADQYTRQGSRTRLKTNQDPRNDANSTVMHLQEEPCVGFIKQQKRQQRAKRYSSPTDPSWSKQWSLLNTGQVGGSGGSDLNVEPAWIQGITGKGVVVAVVDDGLSYTHPDLIPNFDLKGSFDFVGNDPDVMPGFNEGKRDAHGTSCAGEIAMAKDNGVCGVGVAYGARIAGLRLLSTGSTTDASEAMALGYRMNHIDVYSNSWGPIDNGFIVEGPGPLLKAVLENGAKQGRNGKGSIYVWASGNGGQRGDSCATDGYASSIYTIAVGAIDQNGRPAYFDEECTSKMAVTYSYNTNGAQTNQITTTNADGTCRDDFMGTSAACPLVSGAIALALQANPTLTWRDMQYLIAYTSKREPVRRMGHWSRNGAGLWISKSFGFGVVDVEGMVSRARSWTNVPEQQSYTFQPTRTTGNATHLQPLVIRFAVDENADIRFLEHVVVEVTLAINGYAAVYDYSDYYSISSLLNVQYNKQDLDRLVYHSGARRGDISILLKSPHRTHSVLLPYRSQDFVNSDGFDSWPFMSVLHWGEDPRGLWSISISYRSTTGHATVKNVTITLYGSATIPEAVSSIPTKCDPACKGRCAAPGPRACDSCRMFRNATTLECVESCANGFQIHSGYCLDPSINYTYSYTPGLASPSENPIHLSPSTATSFQVSPSVHYTTASLDNKSSTSSSHSGITFTDKIQVSSSSTMGHLVQPSSQSRSVPGTSHSQQQTAAVLASPILPVLPTLTVPSTDSVSSAALPVRLCHTHTWRIALFISYSIMSFACVVFVL